MQNKRCQQCEKQFKPRRKTSRFCSSNCWYDFRFGNRHYDTEKKCQLCGSIFSKRRNLSFKAFSEQMFCSNVCRINWKKTDGYRKTISQIIREWYSNNGFPLPILFPRYSSGYAKWRNEVLKRDNHTCVLCGSVKDLHVDHIIPFSISENKRCEVSNGRTLCFNCHKETNTYGRRASVMRKNLQQLTT